MSALVLQRVIVRMLYDQKFATAVYLDPEVALKGLKLSPEEINWILAVDQRRWSIDQARSHRALEGILLYAPVSIALFIGGGGSPSHLLSFFQDPIFHTCIQRKGHLAYAFLIWLSAQLKHTPRIKRLCSIMCEIERGVIRVQHEGVEGLVLNKPTIDFTDAQSVLFTLTPRAVLLRCPEESVTYYQIFSQSLQQPETTPLNGLPKEVLQLKLSAEDEPLLIEYTESGCTVGAIPEGLYSLLHRCEIAPEAMWNTSLYTAINTNRQTHHSHAPEQIHRGASLSDLCTLMSDAGVEEADALSMIKGFVDDQLIYCS